MTCVVTPTSRAAATNSDIVRSLVATPDKASMHACLASRWQCPLSFGQSFSSTLNASAALHTWANLPLGNRTSSPTSQNAIFIRNTTREQPLCNVYGRNINEAPQPHLLSPTQLDRLFWLADAIAW